MNERVDESEFLTATQLAFAGLLQRGAVTIASSAFDSSAFGNAEVVLVGRRFQVRLVRDRGDGFAEARGLESSEWNPLERVLRAVGAADVPVEGLLTVEQAAKLIEAHINDLESGLAPGNFAETEGNLRRLNAEASKRAEDRWGRGRNDNV
jgi:hypothetical protein